MFLHSCFLTHTPYSPIRHSEGEGSRPGHALNAFQANLAKFTKYKSLNVVSEIKYGHLFNTSSIVSR